MKKGYNGEYNAKQELIKKYKKENVIKVAIGGAMDFIVIKYNRIIKIVEVKETISKKYYPLLQEKEQIQRIICFGKKHKIRSELWIYYRKGGGIKTEKEIRVLYDPNIT